MLRGELCSREKLRPVLVSGCIWENAPAPEMCFVLETDLSRTVRILLEKVRT